MTTQKPILLVSLCILTCISSVSKNCAAEGANNLATLTENTISSENKPPVRVTLGQAFSIKLEGTDCGKVKPGDQTDLEKISLMLDGMDSGLHPLDCDPATNELAFSLNEADVTHSNVSNAAWHALQGHPLTTAKSDFKRELRYTIRQPGGTPELQTLGRGKLQFLTASPSTAILGVIMVLALWISLIYLGRNSGILRDAATGNNLRNRTFSLGRTQMAWWFGIIIGCYIFLWVITEDIPSLSSQALLLMGISGVTSLASAGLDARRKIKLPVGSSKFFDDLLTDANGVTLHRFQMLAMTVILGVMFIEHVATTLTMPKFDATLLALMGIASGTYLGFKFPETHTSDESAPSAGIEEHKSGYTVES